jgi:hypothetical protein
MNRKENFSYDGLDALYEYLTDLEESIGEELELDVIALCCDYMEYGSFEDYKKDYYTNPEDCPYEDLDELSQDYTVIIVEEDGAFIVEAH